MTKLEIGVSADFDATRQKWNARRGSPGTHQWMVGSMPVRSISTIADEIRGTPIFDLGVGAGRTTSLMRLVTDDYVGVDWSSEMVTTSRARYPGTDFRQGDAEDLSFLPEGIDQGSWS